MEVLGHCRSCGEAYDAHWSKGEQNVGTLTRPFCPYCKSLDVQTITDEDYESPIGDDYTDVDD